MLLLLEGQAWTLVRPQTPGRSKSTERDEGQQRGISMLRFLLRCHQRSLSSEDAERSGGRGEWGGCRMLLLCNHSEAFFLRV